MRSSGAIGGEAAGAFPVVAGFCSRLKIRGIVDAIRPVRDLAELTHGQVIEAQLAIRLR